MLAMGALMITRPFQMSDAADVIALWHECGLVRPWNDPRKDIERKLLVNSELFLVGELNREIIATVMGGYEGHRGWINYLAVKPVYQRHGCGQQIMMAIEQLLKARGCPKINLQVRKENVDAVKFYQSLGYDCDELVSMGKRLVTD